MSSTFQYFKKWLFIFENFKFNLVAKGLNKSSSYQFSLALLEGTNNEQPSQNSQYSYLNYLF